MRLDGKDYKVEDATRDNADLLKDLIVNKFALVYFAGIPRHASIIKKAFIDVLGGDENAES